MSYDNRYKTEDQETKQLEDQYWSDFLKGKSLDKYDVKTITTYHVDQFAVAELMMGQY